VRQGMSRNTRQQQQQQQHTCLHCRVEMASMHGLAVNERHQHCDSKATGGLDRTAHESSQQAYEPKLLSAYRGMHLTVSAVAEVQASQKQIDHSMRRIVRISDFPLTASLFWPGQNN
jgi:hypothetical protein